MSGYLAPGGGSGYVAPGAGPGAGRHVVFASGLKAVADFDPATGLGTDNSPKFNPVLAAGNTHLILDGGGGLYGCGAVLTPASNVTIEGRTRGDGLAKLARGFNDGKPLIRNLNYTAYPSPRGVENITLRNMRVYGNRMKGGAGNSTTLVSLYNDSNFVVPTIAFYGVVNALVENVVVTDQVSYGLHFANCLDPTVVNFAAYKVAGDTLDGNDPLHVNGGTFGLRVYGLRGWTNDDFVSLCASDGNDIPGATVTFAPGTVAQGPVDDTKIVGASCVGAANLMRLLSALATCPVTNLEVIGLSGVPTFAGVRLDNFGVPGDGGYYDNLTFRDAYVTGNWATNFGGTQSAAFLVNTARFGVIRLDNFTAAGIGRGINLTNQCVGRHFIVNGRLDVTGTPPVEYGGQIDDVDEDLKANNTSDPAAPSTAFVDSAVTKLTGTGVGADGPNSFAGRYRGRGTANYFRNRVQASGVTPEVIILDGVSHRYTRGGAGVQTDTGSPQVVTSGYDGDHLTEGPVTAKHDGAGWYSSLILRDYFGGATSAALSGHVPNVGAAWLADTVGAGTTQQTGNGFIFAAGGDSYNVAGTQPSDGNFRVRFPSRVLTSGVGHFIFITLFSSANLSDRTGVQLAGDGYHATQITTDVQSTAHLPTLGDAAGELIILEVSEAGTVKTIKSYYSTDEGRILTSLMPDAVITTSAPVKLGVYTSGGAFTPTSGLQIGYLVVDKK